MKKFLITAVVSYQFMSIGFCQPSAREILERVEERFKEIKDYTAEALVSVEMERLRIPRRKITVQFKQPDKFNFDSEGFAIIPREGFGLTSSQFTPEKFDAEIEGQDTINNYRTYKLRLIPKEGSIKGKHLFIWIDTQEWVIRKTESKPFDKRLVNVIIDYGKVENKYLLPSNIRVELKSDEEEADNLPEIKGFENMPRRMPRAGTITITFTKYMVNQNLPDKLFEKEK